MIKSNFLKKLQKSDYMTISLFLIGFAFSAADINLMNSMKNILIVMSDFFFWAAYISMFLLIMLTLRGFIRSADKFKLTSTKLSMDYIKLILLGYYLGFLINISNAFTISLFTRYINRGIS